MLIPIRPSGTKPPMFLLHGNTGFMATGTAFARVSGPDQPIYVLNAKGFDGSEPHQSVDEMVADYLEDVLRITEGGPAVVIGQCWGSLIALELATQLLNRGCQLGPLVLIDPPRVPFRKAVADVSEETTRKLYEYTRGTLIKMSKAWFLELPFDVSDPDQLHIAVLAAMASITALSKFIPRPYFGSVEFILSSDSAAPFFARENPWQRILPNPPVSHVMPFGHNEMIQQNRFEVAGLINLIVKWNHWRQTRLQKLHHGGQRIRTDGQRLAVEPQ
jgi:thioesterase domain-containing protein